MSHRSSAELTLRESEIVVAIAAGLADKTIAYRLGIGARTVRSHITNLERKLGATNRPNLMALCLMRELISRQALSFARSGVPPPSSANPEIELPTFSVKARPMPQFDWPLGPPTLRDVAADGSALSEPLENAPGYHLRRGRIHPGPSGYESL